MKIIVAFFILLFGFFIVVSADSYKKQRYATDHYSPVDAVVTRSEMKCSGTRHGKCHPVIEYAYSYKGINYSSWRYAFISDDGSADRLRRFPLGAKVTAYVDPANPAMSVLDNSPWSVPQVSGMLVLPFLMVFIVLFLLRKRSSRRSPVSRMPDRF